MNLGIENELLEFKKSTSELNEAIIDITAMLNKHGKGTLYFGVRNNGDICGMDISESTTRDVSRKIYEQIKPQIYPTIEIMQIEDKNVILPVSSWDEQNGVCISTPAIVNRNGVKEKIFIPLTSDETSKIKRSINVIKDAIAKIE